MLGTCHQDPSVMSTIAFNDAVSPRFVFCGFRNRLVFTDSSTPLLSISELCCLVIRFVHVHALTWAICSGCLYSALMKTTAL